MRRNIILVTGILICMVGLLALPAAAGELRGKASVVGGSGIDPDLKDALWEIHGQHRLGEYEQNIQTAGAVIETLNLYGDETSNLSVTLAAISGKHDALAAALENGDREALKTINGDLRDLWRTYRMEFRQIVRNEKTSS